MSEGDEDCTTDADVINGNIKAMDQIFPDAHAYTEPPSIQKAHRYSKTSPNRRNLPNKFPIDIYINRFLTMWIMPCNHVTHFLFFATITFFITRRWLPYTVELIALYDATTHQSFAHLGKLECYIEDCPKHIVDELWIGFYTWSTLLAITLWIAWRRVFRRFSGKPWMDPNFTSCNRLPMVTSWMRYMVDENCAREVACRPQLTATAHENYDKRHKPKNYMDLAPNIWNIDGDQWEKRETIQTLANAMDVGNASNMERLTSLFSHEDIQRNISATSISDDEIKNEIIRSFHEQNIILCPHSSTASCAYQSLDKDIKTEDWVIVATAHPAKFETIVEPLIERKVNIPDELKSILNKPNHFYRIKPSLKEFRELSNKYL